MSATPGPWAVKHERWIVATRGAHDGEIIVAPTYWMESSEAKAEAAANARLIAAAPDLLLALQALVAAINSYEFDGNASPECDTARAAIEKATAP